MTNIYILSKSYHNFMFVFCSLFIGGQETTFKCGCYVHTHTHMQKTLKHNMNT